MVKGRWLGRQVLEVMSTDFRDRSEDYYRYAIQAGVVTVNGQVVRPDTKLRSGDRIENVVHKHEPPVTDTPVRILHHDLEREFIVVDKPASIPVHPSGRYYKNSLVEILRTDFGIDKVYPVNRLDRLTSGLIIFPLTAHCARALTDEFMAGTVQKEYVARCCGEFPADEVVCQQPLLTVDRQMGLNIVHPEGKPAKTIFRRLRYDLNTDTSVVQCMPLTGRSHQIRVHLQYLGHPIANDVEYGEARIWGPNLGKGGFGQISANSADPDQTVALPSSPTSIPKPSSPSSIHLHAEVTQVVERLRERKDEEDDWARWRDVVFRAKLALMPPLPPGVAPPPRNRHVSRRHGPRAGATALGGGTADASANADANAGADAVADGDTDTDAQPQLSLSDVLARLAIDPRTPERSTSPSTPAPSPPAARSPGARSPSPPGASPHSGDKPHAPALQYAHDPAYPEPAHAGSPPPHAANPAPAPPREPAPVPAGYCPTCLLPLHPDSDPLSVSVSDPAPELSAASASLDPDRGATDALADSLAEPPPGDPQAHRERPPMRMCIFLHALRYTTSLGVYETELPTWAGAGWSGFGAELKHEGEGEEARGASVDSQPHTL